MLLESLLSFHGELKVSTLAKSGQEFSTIRPRPEVMQAIRNLGALEIAIVALLEKDGHPAPKDELRRTADRQAMIAFGLPAPYVAALSGAGLSPPSRHSNIVLPDPIDWDRIRESERRLKVELQLQYNTLLEIVSTVQPKGNWMYVLADLTRPVDADRLLISSVPDLVLRHPETTVENIPADLIQKVRDAITQTRDSVDRRRSVALQSGLVSLAARLGPVIPPQKECDQK